MLAAEAWQESGIAHWMIDIVTTAASKDVNTDRISSVRNVQAPDSLPGEQILDHVLRPGWMSAARRSYITDLEFAMPRIQRLMGDRPQASGPPPMSPDDPSGVHRFARE